MVNFSKLLSKLSGNQDEGSGVLDVDRAFVDRLPYACHYAPDVLLTKNGELLQIIEVPDFSSKLEFRKELRGVLAKNIEGGDFALTIHNVRIKGGVGIPWREDARHGFAYHLHQKWTKQEKTELKYKNKIYISIIARGLTSKANLLNIPLSFLFTYIKNKYAKFLQTKYEELSSLTEKIVNSLQPFHAKKLGLVSGNHSELLSVLRQLVTLFLDTNPVELEKRDLSRQLIDDVRTVFGFNAFEVWCGNKKKIAAVIGVKPGNGIEATLLSMKLYMDIEFVIVERIDFDSNATQLKQMTHQRYLLDVAGQNEFTGVVKLDGLDQDKHKYINNCVDVLVIADSGGQLEQSIGELVESFSECGIAFFRHDLSLENSFLSLFPANFAFHTLSSFGFVDWIGEFALLGGLISGKRECDQWGYAITLFWSLHNTPYFFKFHNDAGNGHTMVIGRNNTGKTILQNFIISEASKIGVKTFIIDVSQKSCIFVNALNGEYRSINKSSIHKIGCNPFTLEDSHNARAILYYLMVYVGIRGSKSKLRETCAAILSLPVVERTEKGVSEIMLKAGYEVKTLFAEGSVLSLLFNVNEKYEEVWAHNTVGFYLPDNHDGRLMVLMVMLILYKIEVQLDGSPALIVLEEAWKVGKVFSNDNNVLHEFLKRMSQLNCVVMFTGSDMNSMLSDHFTGQLQKLISTQIFLPGYIMGKQHSQVFNLTQQEALMINGLQGYNRNFFVKQDGSAVVLKLNMSGMVEYKVLSSTSQNIEHMKSAIAESGSKDSNDWLPIFYTKVSE